MQVPSHMPSPRPTILEPHQNLQTASVAHIKMEYLIDIILAASKGLDVFSLNIGRHLTA